MTGTPSKTAFPTARHRFAVLIDAENAQAAVCKTLLAEIAKFGIATVKRAYGDWTTSRLNGWKQVLHQHAIQPIQQFTYTTRKNATDSAMIIDAMDLLYTGRLEGFCIVSSDSDFTRLATRLRESGVFVIGAGEQKTPRPFVTACDQFLYTENLHDADDRNGSAENGATSAKGSPSVNGSSFVKGSANGSCSVKGSSSAKASPSVNGTPVKKSTQELQADTMLAHLLQTAAESATDESGWANLGTVGIQIAKLSPEFNSRNFGYSNLSRLLKASELFDVEERSSKPGQSQFHIRDKRQPKSPETAHAVDAPQPE